MYERSASVLERYFDKIFGFNKSNNLKNNYENYKALIEEMEEYQKIVKEEEKIMKKFDEAARQIETLLNEQAPMHTANVELEEKRNQLFNDLGENPNQLDQKLQKIERQVDENQEKLKELREKYVEALVIFTERQKERNKNAHTRRKAESNHMSTINTITKMFETIDKKDAVHMKRFIDSDKKAQKEEIVSIMIKNGKNEKVGFNEDVIRKAVDVRMEIAIKEATIYITVYSRMKKILDEINNENIRLDRAQKLLKDSSVRLHFLNAEKEYIVGFLDNERMTAMNGKNAHDELMKEACKNFKLDIIQINNLYELINKEATGKATKKSYKELYNKTYLKNIEEKEKNFVAEVNNIKINMGTVINSNYWRIEGMKNVYMVFQEEVSKEFEKDLSEYRIEEAKQMSLPYETIVTDNNSEEETLTIDKFLEENKHKKLYEQQYENSYNDIQHENDYKDIQQAKIEEFDEVENFDEVEDIDQIDILDKIKQLDELKTDEVKQTEKLDDNNEFNHYNEEDYEYENPYKNAFKEYEEKEILEDRIDEIIKNSRKRSNRNRNKDKQMNDRRFI